MLQSLAAFCRNESGATAIEYGLIAAGISIAIIVAEYNVLIGADRAEVMFADAPACTG
jgi:Flp pilus assembly pilin Flp